MGKYADYGAAADAELADLRAQLSEMTNKLAAATADDAADAATITNLQGQVASLTAEVARLNLIINPQPTGPGIVRFQDIPAQSRITQALAQPVAAGKQISFAPGTYETSGFLDFGNPPTIAFGDIWSAGIIGSGVDKTIFQVKPNSSAKAGWYENIKRNTAYPVGFIACTQQNGWCLQVIVAGTTGATAPAGWVQAANNALPAGTLSGDWKDGTVTWRVVGNTNQVYDMLFQGAQVRQISDFWLKATPQGHLRGGLRLNNTVLGALVKNVKVSGYAGSNPGNPGEIFTVATNRCNDLVFDNVEIDGRDDAGNRVGVSMLGLNNGSNINVKGGYFHHTRTDMGAGVAAWQMNNIRYTGTRAEDTGTRGFSHERCGGDIILDHITALRCAGSHAKFDSDLGSAKVQIIDPVFDGSKFLVKINANYLNGQKQNPADITLTKDGVPRPDLLHIF